MTDDKPTDTIDESEAADRVEAAKEAMAVIVRCARELSDAIAALEARYGPIMARGVTLAVTSQFALPPGKEEHLDVRTVCAALCMRMQWPNPFPEAYGEARDILDGEEAKRNDS